MPTGWSADVRFTEPDAEPGPDQAQASRHVARADRARLIDAGTGASGFTVTQVVPGDTRHGPGTLVGFVSGNAAVAGAVMFYMGWVYTDAWLGHFDVNPLDLNIGFTEYALRGLSVFSPAIVAVGAVVVLLTVHGLVAAPALSERGQRNIRRVASALTIGGIAAYLLAGTVNVSTYLVLGLLGIGPLLAVRTAPATPPSRYVHSLALVIAALCGLWALALYADAKGTQAAHDIARELPDRTAAVVYSTRRLAISGPGVQVEQLPKGAQYGFRYTGLRLLVARGDRYYLLPVGWSEKLSATYILRDGDDVRVELYAGSR